jgi:hypothetical protein
MKNTRVNVSEPVSVSCAVKAIGLTSRGVKPGSVPNIVAMLAIASLLDFNVAARVEAAPRPRDWQKGKWGSRRRTGPSWRLIGAGQEILDLGSTLYEIQMRGSKALQSKLCKTETDFWNHDAFPRLKQNKAPLRE